MARITVPIHTATVATAAITTATVAVAVAATAAATAVSVAITVDSPPPPPVSRPSPPQQSPQPQLSQRVARELGSNTTDSDEGNVVSGRTKGETARRQGGCVGSVQGGRTKEEGGSDARTGQTRGEAWRHPQDTDILRGATVGETALNREGYVAWAAVGDGSTGRYRPCTFPPSPTARESSPPHTPGKRPFDVELAC